MRCVHPLDVTKARSGEDIPVLYSAIFGKTLSALPLDEHVLLLLVLVIHAWPLAVLQLEIALNLIGVFPLFICLSVCLYVCHTILYATQGAIEVAQEPAVGQAVT